MVPSCQRSCNAVAELIAVPVISVVGRGRRGVKDVRSRKASAAVGGVFRAHHPLAPVLPIPSPSPPFPPPCPLTYTPGSWGSVREAVGGVISAHHPLARVLPLPSPSPPHFPPLPPHLYTRQLGKREKKRLEG